jgi:hypothetical protein
MPTKRQILAPFISSLWRIAMSEQIENTAARIADIILAILSVRDVIAKDRPDLENVFALAVDIAALDRAERDIALVLPAVRAAFERKGPPRLRLVE